MKICWDNLEGVYLTRNGVFIKDFNSYVEKEKCVVCNEPYLTSKTRQSNFCDRSCALKKRKFSKKTRQKMSKAWERRGPVSEETRNKQSEARKGFIPWNKNKKHSEEVKERMSKSQKKRFENPENHPMYNKSHSEKTKRKLSIINIGELNGNWKGGISCEPYCFEWSSKEFKDFIKERDGNRCLNPDCWGNIHKLSVHHIDYNKKNCESQNLITLCTSCNSRANKDRGWHEAWYKAIINRRYVNGSANNQFSL